MHYTLRRQPCIKLLGYIFSATVGSQPFHGFSFQENYSFQRTLENIFQNQNQFPSHIGMLGSFSWWIGPYITHWNHQLVWQNNATLKVNRLGLDQQRRRIHGQGPDFHSPTVYPWVSVVLCIVFRTDNYGIMFHDLHGNCNFVVHSL